ncbi:Fatty acid metabolism regulator protein [Enhygromyxa salina]|uniref:Fatty acid metabolism regulator protein n=1 Tax=Enhygromyxa salina TaxID=215803 RepID=A0A2S9YH09_9BACT|nr:TetR/AcrR family transcriptional regulator [Enhygromyxa salina]PRQ04322.1 Fatty acid metabolism regulator protein [Enhygromyxa salina]
MELPADLTRELEKFVGNIDPSTKKGRKRLAILEAAISMFAESGYRATSMDELASEVGVAKGTLYLYFPKKVDLLIACVAYEKLRWVPELSAVLTGSAPAPERLKQWIVAVLLLPSRSPLMLRLLEDAEMAAMLADIPPELMSEGEHFNEELLQPLLDEVAGPEHRWSPVELRDRVQVIASLSHIAPALRYESLRPGMSPERFAAILADFVVDGIRPRPEGDQST